MRAFFAGVLFVLNSFLLQESELGRTTVLILDEAHRLSDEVLEEVRPLGNVETRKGKLLQIVLAGQGELDLRMESPALRQAKQRIVLRCRLDAFTEDDTRRSILARLEKAGMPNQTVLPPAILTQIYLALAGHPEADQLASQQSAAYVCCDVIEACHLGNA